MLQEKIGPLALPVDLVSNVFSNKWKILIIGYLMGNKLRFNELKRVLVGISAKVLTENLRALEELGMIKRKVIPDTPVKVEYELSEIGLSLYPIFYEMYRWKMEYPNKQVTKSKLVI